MEYIDGRDIGTYIHDYFPAPFDDTSIDEVFVQLIDAFSYIEAHGIIHRDIREGNILIDRSGLVKVIDFGIGKVYEKAENAEDSLALQINRDGSDTLPQEYYEGIYTSQTDQFYLAELLNRLMSNAENKYHARGAPRRMKTVVRRATIKAHGTRLLSLCRFERDKQISLCSPVEPQIVPASLRGRGRIAK